MWQYVELILADISKIYKVFVNFPLLFILGFLTNLSGCLKARMHPCESLRYYYSPSLCKIIQII